MGEEGGDEEGMGRRGDGAEESRQHKHFSINYSSGCSTPPAISEAHSTHTHAHI